MRQTWIFNIIFIVYPFHEDKLEDSHIPLSMDASWLSIGEIPTLWARDETTVSHPKKSIGLILWWVSTISQFTYLPIYTILPPLISTIHVSSSNWESYLSDMPFPQENASKKTSLSGTWPVSALFFGCCLSWSATQLLDVEVLNTTLLLISHCAF